MNQEKDFGSANVKKLIWTGPVVETREGEYRAGFGTVYIETGPKGRSTEIGTSYSWQGKVFAEKGHAIFAARKEVENQQSYDRAPERFDVSDAQRRVEAFFKGLGLASKASHKQPRQEKSHDRIIDR